jgi:hypothetical protein
MGQEWIEIIKKGNKAFSRKQYSQACGLYSEVLAEAGRNLRQVIILSRENITTVQEFCLCSRVAANALLKNGQATEAERIYCNAASELKPFISNLNNPLLYRALLFTEFKLIFYGLADLYVSNKQLDRLNAYMRKNNSLLKKWSEELQMISQLDGNLN